MNEEIAGQSGNNKSESVGLIGGRGSKLAQGDGAGGLDSVAPAPEPITFDRGTEDIVHVYRDGQVRYFAGTVLGANQSNYYFESHARQIFSIHFGKSCYYVNRAGKIGARVHMTRREFWQLMKTAHGLEVAV